MTSSQQLFRVSSIGFAATVSVAQSTSTAVSRSRPIMVNVEPTNGVFDNHLLMGKETRRFYHEERALSWAQSRVSELSLKAAALGGRRAPSLKAATQAPHVQKIVAGKAA